MRLNGLDDPYLTQSNRPSLSSAFGASRRGHGQTSQRICLSRNLPPAPDRPRLLWSRIGVVHEWFVDVVPEHQAHSVLVNKGVLLPELPEGTPFGCVRKEDFREILSTLQSHVDPVTTDAMAQSRESLDKAGSLISKDQL